LSLTPAASVGGSRKAEAGKAKAAAERIVGKSFMMGVQGMIMDGVLDVLMRLR
jgi:hypothetical protein